MKVELSKRWTERWEGRRTSVYLDTKGIATVGVGLNLESTYAASLVESIGINYQDLLNEKIALTNAQVDLLFDASHGKAMAATISLFPSVDEYPEPQQIVLVDLMFNMGYGTLSKFNDTIRSIKNQDWTSAAGNLKNSAWFHQVGDRGIANVAVLGNTATIESYL